MKQKGMAKSLLVVILSLLLVSLVALTGAGCGEEVSLQEEGTGTLVLNLCDAPKDDPEVVGVYIKIMEIQYHLGGENDGEWATFPEFVGPETYNLTALTGGVSALLGEFELPAGNYTQIRFMLDIREQGSSNNTGCYVKLIDETTAPLFCPSGNQTGYKAVGNFTVPENGKVEVTADWDVQKAVVKAGQSGKYILKPTIHLIVTDLAPEASTGLESTAGNAQVALNWDDNTEGDLAGYNVYRSEDIGGPYTETEKIATVTASEYTDTGLTNDTTYYYVVTALDDLDNESVYSAEVSATPSSS